MAYPDMKRALLIVLIVLLAVPAMAELPPGRITVYSTPSGLRACIDNKSCDITPATFAIEGNAWHMVVVTEKGFLDWTQVVYVTSDQTTQVNAYLDLDPAATAIQVNMTPGGGIVCLDNSQCRPAVGTVNTTGSTLYTGVSPGYHTISVESPAGYMDTSQLVQVNLGKITNVDIVLERAVTPTITATRVPAATGMVRVYVDRTGSTICIDNHDCAIGVGGSAGPGTGTTIFNSVTANETHIVTVAADGFRPYSSTVSVEKDMIVNVDVRLQPIAGGTTVPATTLPTTAPTTAPPVVTTVTKITGASPPAVPVQTRSPLDVVPVLGALALCGMVSLFRNGRE